MNRENMNQKKDEPKKTTDLRVIKTRKALCDAFLTLISEKRFEDITVGELCDRALVRRATFYKHYADKYEFFSYFIRQYEEIFTEDAREHQQDSLSDYSVFMFRQCIHFMEEHRAMMESILKSNLLPVILDLFTEEISRNTLQHIRGNASVRSALPASPETVSAFYAGGTSYMIRQWFSAPVRPKTEEICRDFEQILRASSEV